MALYLLIAQVDGQPDVAKSIEHACASRFNGAELLSRHCAEAAALQAAQVRVVFSLSLISISKHSMNSHAYLYDHVSPLYLSSQSLEWPATLAHIVPLVTPPRTQHC